MVECPKLPTPEFDSYEYADLCLDAFYSEQLGVIDVIVGYTGGIRPYPTYSSIKDHTEGVRIKYDPNLISYHDILELYFQQLGDKIYIPPIKNQYRYIILVYNNYQYEIARKYIQYYKNLKKMKEIYIDLEYVCDFYRAEEYHQKYYQKNF